MLPATSIAHIALYCTDLMSMERFYCDTLGYRVVWRPDSDNCYLSRGKDSLALHVGPPTKAESRLDHFGMTLDCREHVQQWAQHLIASGIALEAPPRTHRDGSTSFYVRDPEGNRIQFLHLGPGMTFAQEGENRGPSQT
ncbi:MAG TPA: VOC family protein [Polyangiaceae bacterium]|nr:MAG: Glyoxalase-like domain protein [Deltaproteobacteria bacterium ADurb.Bin207]HNS98739.1 VOC family protein [Polyangiaceae bacterium]HNZ22696.1 VOC family protein [Polyangiaceae bacterium]HOD24331.1 VOC family protein [Polyangiaceae bacterium]HOE49260.1 VOC family protein [Polyangiaceae bacterium]